MTQNSFSTFYGNLYYILESLVKNIWEKDKILWSVTGYKGGRKFFILFKRHKILV